MKKLTATLCLTIAVLLGSSGVSYANAVDLDLSGDWQLVRVETAGIYSGGAIVAAKKIIGTKISIRNSEIVFPDRTSCKILSTSKEVRQNDYKSFGTGGGSWGNLGLKKSPDGSYKIIRFNANCKGPFWALLLNQRGTSTCWRLGKYI